MYDIQSTDYGYRLEFKGYISRKIAQRWVDESRLLLEEQHEPFTVLIDAREMKQLEADARAVMVVGSGSIDEQLRGMARQSGIMAGERIVDASRVHDWEKVAFAWLREGIEPPVSVKQRSSPASAERAR